MPNEQPIKRPGAAPGLETVARRRLWLRAFARGLGSGLDDLCSLTAEEMGKSEWEVLSSELMPLMASIKWHRRRLGRLLRPRRVSGGALWQFAQRQRVHRRPLGRVGIIATWNYPIQLLGIQLVQAIAAGNRVVVKPSEHSPESQRRLLEIARDAGLPPGTLDWTEPTREAGARLLAEHELDHVLFTGSTEVGRLVGATCAEGLVSSTLELSGRDSAIVLDDADPALAAESVWHALVMNAGQTCMAPRRVLTTPAVHDAFCTELARRAEATDPVRLVQPEEVSRCRSLVEEAIEAGGRCVPAWTGPLDERTMRPVAIMDCPPEASVVEGRHFGPLLAVLRCADLDDVLRRHREVDQVLATSVFTSRPRRVEPLLDELGSGIVTINDCVLPAGHPSSPITGRSASGWGSSQGVEGLMALTRPVVLSRTGRIGRLPTEEPGPRIQDFLKGMMRRGAGRG